MINIVFFANPRKSKIFGTGANQLTHTFSSQNPPNPEDELDGFIEMEAATLA